MLKRLEENFKVMAIDCIQNKMLKASRWRWYIVFLSYNYILRGHCTLTLDKWPCIERDPPTHTFIACSHRRHGQDKTVSSCPCWPCEHNWRQDKTVSMSFVLSRPSFQFATVRSQIYWGIVAENLVQAVFETNDLPRRSSGSQRLELIAAREISLWNTVTVLP